MKHRKLRFAWSVAWGIVAVLLVALRTFQYPRLLYKKIVFARRRQKSVPLIVQALA
jgi:hypothetical protein